MIDSFLQAIKDELVFGCPCWWNSRLNLLAVRIQLEKGKLRPFQGLPVLIHLVDEEFRLGVGDAYDAGNGCPFNGQVIGRYHVLLKLRNELVVQIGRWEVIEFCTRIKVSGLLDPVLDNQRTNRCTGNAINGFPLPSTIRVLPLGVDGLAIFVNGHHLPFRRRGRLRIIVYPALAIPHARNGRMFAVGLRSNNIVVFIFNVAVRIHRFG